MATEEQEAFWPNIYQSFPYARRKLGRQALFQACCTINSFSFLRKPYYPHFLDKKTEAQTDEVTGLRSLCSNWQSWDPGSVWVSEASAVSAVESSPWCSILTAPLGVAPPDCDLESALGPFN